MLFLRNYRPAPQKLHTLSAVFKVLREQFCPDSQYPVNSSSVCNAAFLAHRKPGLPMEPGRFPWSLEYPDKSVTVLMADCGLSKGEILVNSKGSSVVRASKCAREMVRVQRNVRTI